MLIDAHVLKFDIMESPIDIIRAYTAGEVFVHSEQKKDGQEPTPVFFGQSGISNIIYGAWKFPG